MLHFTPEILAVIGSVLTAIYIIGYPAFEIGKILVGALALGSTDFSSIIVRAVYQLPLLPALLFSLLWTYGTYWMLREKKDKFVHTKETITGFVIVIASVFLLHLLESVIGVYYQFVL